MNSGPDLYIEECAEIHEEDMFDDIQGQDMSRVTPVPEEFLPYSCMELTKSLVEYAGKFLNETEDTRTKCLGEIKELIEKEFQAFRSMDDILLLCFLRSRRFDVQLTRNLMKNVKDFFDSYRHLFERIDSDVVRRVIQTQIAGFLPYRDSSGRPIVLLRAECWNPDELRVEDMIFGQIVALHIAGENPVNQVAGFVVIVDFKGMSLKQVKAMSSWMLIGVQVLQKCSPFLVKEFHVIHTPMLFRIVWKIVSPLIREQIKKRITFHNTSDYSSLHQHIPPCILPEELGGQLGPYSHEHWATDASTITKKFFEKCGGFLTT